MKKLRKVVPVVLGVIAVIAIAGANSASATTLEVGGVKQSQSVAFAMSLVPNTSSITKTTSDTGQHTCTTSDIQGTTDSPYTGTKVTGPVTTMTFSNCTRPMVVHDPGKLWFEYSAGTNGTVFSEETDVTKGTVFGTLTCTTGTGTHIGTLTGVASGHAILDVNAVLKCGLIPSMKWEASYTVTSPSGLGVVS